MATLREIQLRLKSVQNIAKITKSMKMIAATKLTRAQRAMESGRVYGTASNDVYVQAASAEVASEKPLLITASSDRGLCGGIHSSVSKHTKRALVESPIPIVVLGDKARTQLQRTQADIRMTFNQIGKSIPNFDECCGIIDVMKKNNVEFDVARIIYNRFKSMISYESEEIKVYSQSILENSPNFATYEIEDDVLENFQEYTMANAVYWALVEGHAAEMAARRTAMENATKNAGDMIDRLTLTYNRGRQAVITNELIDIIIGASAL